FDAWWRLEDEILWGSMDALSWHRLGVQERIAYYLASQAPITALRRVDVIRTMVLGAIPDPASAQVMRAFADAYRDHPDFQPSWLHHTNQTWISAAHAHLR